MASLKFDAKDLRDTVDYQFEWDEFLDADETIETCEVTCADNALAISAVSKSPVIKVAANGTTTNLPDKGVTFWASAGVAGTTYEVECEVTTTGGKTANRKAKLAVKDL